jgi:hypothetical protein
LCNSGFLGLMVVSLSDLISADVTNVIFNTSDFAESVVREVGGDPDVDQAVSTAIVYKADVETTNEMGKAVVAEWRMDLPGTVEVEQDDIYVIGSERFRVSDVDDVENGVIHCRLVRLNDKWTEAKGVRFLR